MTVHTTDDNKKVIAEYFTEYWDKGNAVIDDKLCTHDYLINYPMHGPVNTPEGAIAVGRWDGGGTHAGLAFADLALGKLDDTNTVKKIRFTGTAVFRMEGVKVREEIGEEGELRACSQLVLVNPLRWT